MPPAVRAICSTPHSSKADEPDTRKGRERREGFERNAADRIHIGIGTALPADAHPKSLRSDAFAPARDPQRPASDAGPRPTRCARALRRKGGESVITQLVGAIVNPADLLLAPDGTLYAIAGRSGGRGLHDGLHDHLIGVLGDGDSSDGSVFDLR
jgi:hypothetical protein